MDGVRIFTSENEKNLLAQKVNALETALGINAKELSRLCGISDSTVYRIEGRSNQEAGISEKLMRKICERTGADPNWMTDFDDTSLNVVWLRKPTIKETPEASGKRVRMIRKEMKMTQKEFAEMIGSSVSNYSAIEQGRVGLTKGMAKQIAKYINPEYGSAEWLLSGEERNRIDPVNDEMIEWLKDHPEERKAIWAKIKKQAT